MLKPILNMAFIVFLYTACETIEPKPMSYISYHTAELPAFDLEGHRGARGLAPENSIPGMLMALEWGVTTLEMDVHMSKDKEVLLSHDPFFNPKFELLPNGEEIPAEEEFKHILYKLYYNEIKRYDIGSKFNKDFPQQKLQKTYKPLLAEVMDSVQSYIVAHQLKQVFYNIETKSNQNTDGIYHPGPEEFIDRLMDVIINKKLTSYVIIQSFDVRTLQVVKKKYPGIKTSLLVQNKQTFESNLEFLGFVPDIYSPQHKLIDTDLIQKAHEQNIKVIPWTVNNLAEMRELKKVGVDGIITDYPNLFKEL